MLKSPRVTREDKLRLVLLYSLRYENMAERTIGKFMHSLYEAVSPFRDGVLVHSCCVAVRTYELLFFFNLDGFEWGDEERE